MKAMLIRTTNGIAGATPEDDQAWSKFKRRLERFKRGEYIKVEWYVPRNPKHHRKLFALITLITENSEVYDTKERALVAIKMAAGFFDLYVDPVTGSLEKVPHSIAYDEMCQDDFDRFYDAAIHGVVTSIVPQMELTDAACRQLLEKIIHGWASRVPDFGDLN